MVEEALIGRGELSRVGTNVSMGATGSLLFFLFGSCVTFAAVPNEPDRHGQKGRAEK